LLDFLGGQGVKEGENQSPELMYQFLTQFIRLLLLIPMVVFVSSLFSFSPSDQDSRSSGKIEEDGK